MQVADGGGGKLPAHHVADFLDHRLIHLRVQQDLAGLAQQPERPARHQDRPDDTHHRVEPCGAVKLAADQRHDGQHGGGRIRDHVQVGRAQVHVVVVTVRVVVRMSVIVPVMVAVLVTMLSLQQPCAQQVDAQAEHGNRDGFVVVDRGGYEQAPQRLDHHQRGNHRQQHGAAVAAEYLDLPGAEGEAAVPGVAPRQRISHDGKPHRQRMRTHVPAIGQQRHRIQPVAADDLHHHHRRGDVHHAPGIALRLRIDVVELVAVGERGDVGDGHEVVSGHILPHSI